MAWSIQLALMGVAASAAAQAPPSFGSTTGRGAGHRFAHSARPGGRPAPITVINAEQIRSSGFTSVPDVLRAMT
jgi:hypothetical protein